MTQLIASRVYSKRETEKSDWSGRIGHTEFAIESDSDIHVYLDENELSPASIEYLMTFALQSMQDAYAGADSLQSAIGAFEKKRDAIIAGTIGVRGTGDGASYFTTVARSIVRANVKSAWGAKSQKWLDFAKLDDDAQDAKLDAVYAANEAVLKPKVEAEIERRTEAARAKKATIAPITIDL